MSQACERIGLKFWPVIGFWAGHMGKILICPGPGVRASLRAREGPGFDPKSTFSCSEGLNVLREPINPCLSTRFGVRLPSGYDLSPRAKPAKFRGPGYELKPESNSEVPYFGPGL